MPPPLSFRSEMPYNPRLTPAFAAQKDNWGAGSLCPGTEAMRDSADQQEQCEETRGLTSGPARTTEMKMTLAREGQWDARVNCNYEVVVIWSFRRPKRKAYISGRQEEREDLLGHELRQIPEHTEESLSFLRYLSFLHLRRRDPS